jgi:hypothetical protein
MSAADTHRMATYYVVPIVPGSGGTTENCFYYEKIATKDGHEWVKVPAKELNSKNGRQDRSSDLVQEINPPGTYDPSVTLFAGVAKTFDADRHLTNLFLAGVHQGRPIMVIPVADQTRRGVILVFAKESGNVITELIASTDPEIKNS